MFGAVGSKTTGFVSHKTSCADNIASSSDQILGCLSTIMLKVGIILRVYMREIMFSYLDVTSSVNVG